MSEEEGKCPNCGELLVYPRGDDSYCEECGWNCGHKGYEDCFEEPANG